MVKRVICEGVELDYSNHFYSVPFDQPELSHISPVTFRATIILEKEEDEDEWIVSEAIAEEDNEVFGIKKGESFDPEDSIDVDQLVKDYLGENKTEIMLSTNPTVEKYLEMAIKSPDLPFEYNDTTFINLKNLYDFVEANSKEGFTFEKVIKEVIEKVYTSGGSDVEYELRSYETKSGHAESISFKVECEYDEDQDESKYTLTF